MNAVFLVIVLLFVFAVLALVAYSIFELTPWVATRTTTATRPGDAGSAAPGWTEDSPALDGFSS